MAARRATQRHDTLALVLRRTEYGEADLVVTLFTHDLGRVAALARSARKSQRRFGGQLEPLHTLSVLLDASASAGLLRLAEARIVTPRPHLLENGRALDAAGKLTSWIRKAAPENIPEPALWELATAGLDELEAAASAVRAGAVASSAGVPSPALTLARYGLRLLVASGFRLELERCVQSGVRCPPGKAAMIDPERGGLVSSAHGGAPFKVDGATRARLIAAQDGVTVALEEADADLARELVERCLRAHAGLEP
jgi:DNA repair protein RecO (recombination protein O)